MDRNDSTKSLLLEKKVTTAKSSWLTDTGDLFVLLCHFLLTTASIMLIALTIHTQMSRLEPSKIILILQRGIAALSTTITSALIMVAGKRYVFFKFARGGIRSRRVAVYSSPSIGNLVPYLLQHGFELPLLTLLAVWALGLATALTVNDVWEMVPSRGDMIVSFPFGPFDTHATAGPALISASALISYVTALACSGVSGIAGVINVTSDKQLTSGGPMGMVLYPPVPGILPNMAFSVSTALNGFNISMEPVSSVPHTAQNLTCIDSSENGNGFSTGQLWYEGGDNQTLSIIASLADSSYTSTSTSPSLYRFNASAIILGGTLHATGNTTEFALNGTTLPNVMSDDLWAQDIVSLVCNATLASAGNCYSGSSLFDFAQWLNQGAGNPATNPSNTDTPTLAGIYWSTVLGMAIGAYSAAWSVTGFQSLAQSTPVAVDATFLSFLSFTSNYGVYVLAANVLVSVTMLAVVVRLRVASHLGGDFIQATRLLLCSLKNPELFNASLDTTVDALANPYMLVRDESEFILLAENELPKETRKRWARWRR